MVDTSVILEKLAHAVGEVSYISPISPLYLPYISPILAHAVGDVTAPSPQPQPPAPSPIP